MSDLKNTVQITSIEASFSTQIKQQDEKIYL